MNNENRRTNEKEINLFESLNYNYASIQEKNALKRDYSSEEENMKCMKCQ